MRLAWLLALAFAGGSVALDSLLHYSLPQSWALREGALYFISKFVIFALVAYALLTFYQMKHPLVWGIAASAAFGLFYYLFPVVSVGYGHESILFRGSWGAIHAGIGTAVASLILMRHRWLVAGAILVALGLLGVWLNTFSLPQILGGI